MPWPETVWPWMTLSLSSSKLLRPAHSHKIDWPRPAAIIFKLPRLEVQGLSQHGWPLWQVYFARISCWRMGILSMLRLNSLASQGNGLRNFICPSLPISSTANPRGRNFLRRAVSSAGFASTNTTTSRAANSSAPWCKDFIWVWKFTSKSVFAKTITGRFTHKYPSIVVSYVTSTKMVSRLSAPPKLGSAATQIAAINDFMMTPFKFDIGLLKAFAKRGSL